MGTKAIKWKVKCRIQKGMFDDEYVVMIDTIDNEGRSTENVSFVDKDDLSGVELPKNSDSVVEGLLSISPMQIDQYQAMIVLPRPTVANGPVVLVRTSNLSS